MFDLATLKTATASWDYFHCHKRNFMTLTKRRRETMKEEIDFFFGSCCRSVTLPIRLRLRLTEGISASRWYVIGQHFFYQLVLPLRRQLAQPKHVQLKWLEYLKIFKYGHL
jgi:hypothetical protein